MESRRNVSPRSIGRIAPNLLEWTYRPVGNTLASFAELVGSMPAQYSSVVTLGTVMDSVFTKLVDPGIDVKLKEAEAELVGVFENIDAANASTLGFYWRARTNSNGTQQGWVDLTGTVSQVVPTDGVALDIATIPVRGLIDVGNLDEAPFDLQLMAYSSVDSALVAKVKNTTELKLVGIVIPGT